MNDSPYRRPPPGFAVVALLLALILAGCGSTGRAGQAPSVAIKGLFPPFDPAKARYVSRCGRGAAPIEADAGKGASIEVGSAPSQRGRTQIHPDARPGENFPITVFRGEHREAYRVRCLPADFPDWHFEALQPVPPGLFTVAFQASKGVRPWVIVFDQEGVPRWWYNPTPRALWAQVLRNGSLAWARSFGDGYGLDPRMAHEVRSPSGRLLRLVKTRGTIVDGHEFRELANGNVLLDAYTPETADLRRFGGPAKAAIVSAEIQELDPHGRVLWRWNSGGHIGLGETGRWWYYVLRNSRRRLQGLAAYDPVHINSIEPRGHGEVVISTRHTDAVYGIRRSSGEIAWKLGGTPTADSLRIIGDPASKLLGGQHDARIARDGSLSVYDNGKDRPRRSRVVFYRLDLKRREAVYRGQLNDRGVRTSHCCGSARQLPNGGWLVSWGDNPLVTEFDPQGKVAFRLRLPAPTFRAVPVPSGATSIAGLDHGLEQLESRQQGVR